MSYLNQLTNSGKEELKALIVDAINDGRIEGNPISEIHTEIFNTDYFIIGYYDAEQWMIKNYGSVFSAIGTVQEYEQDQYGQVNTDLSSSESVCNMLTYILGEEVLQDISTIGDNWDEEASKLICNRIKYEIENDGVCW